MLPKNNSNDDQKPTHSDLEESNAQRDLQGDGSLQNSIATGITTTLIHLFYDILIFALLLLPIMIWIWIEEMSSTLLAWFSGKNNKIRIVELESKQEYANFDGVKLSNLNDGIFDLIIFGSKMITIH